MTETNSLVIEKINQIKYKLNKYINLKENNKIKDYLNALNNIENINVEILKETLIVDCLTTIKKSKESIDISQIAENIIKKWKAICSSNNKNIINSTADIKKEAKSHQNEIKSKDSTNTKKLSANDKSKSKSNLNDLNKNKIKNEKSNIEYKLEETEEDDHSSISNQPKKQKLSLNDYKIKKEISDDHSESLSFSSSSSNSSSSSLNFTTTNSKTDGKQTKIKQEEYKGKINTEKTGTKSSSSINVPLPTVPLPNIISIENTSFNRSSNFNYQSSLQRSSVTNLVAKDSTYDGENELLTQIMSDRSKRSERRLYTGKKNTQLGATFQVPKLFDLSVKVLVNTLDELPNRISIYNTVNDFPIAFDLIKPVLEKANSKQLSLVEHYSPNLIEDTEHLWKRIYETDFKNLERPEDDESWRDLYFKKVNEREENLRRVRDKISSKYADQPKKRETQIATVKFGSTQSKSSSSSIISNKNKNSIASSSIPVRAIIRDEPSRKISSSSGFPSRKPSQQQGPGKSQGMKAVSKLLKKNMRR